MKKIIGFTSIGLFSNFFVMFSIFLFIKGTDPELSGAYFYYVTIFGVVSNATLFGYATYFNKISFDIRNEKQSTELGNVKFYIIISLLLTLIVIPFSGYEFLIVISIYFENTLLKILRERFYCSLCRVRNELKNYLTIQLSTSVLKLAATYFYFKSYISFNELLVSYIITPFIFICFAREFIIEIYHSKTDNLKLYLKKGRMFFLSTIFIMGYDYAPVLFLKIINNNMTQISYFTSTYKIISIFILSLGILTQSLLPLLREKYINFGARKTLNVAITTTFLLSILYVPVYLALNHHTHTIILFLLGESFLSSSDTFKILLIAVWGSIFNFILFSGLQAINRESYIPKIIAPSVVINFFLLIFLSKFGAYGAALSLTISLLICAISTLFITIKVRNDKI